MPTRPADGPPVTVGLNAVIVTVDREVPRVLTVDVGARPSTATKARPAMPASNRGVDADAADGKPPERVPPESARALPFGPLDPVGDVTLERALLRWVREQTGLELDWVEQLYTFGDQYRNPTEIEGGPRTVSVAYLVLVEAGRPIGAQGARWQDCYAFFPWEDWRAGRPALIDARILPVLERWASAAPGPDQARARRERVDIVFGRGGMAWDGDRVLDRYELLYEVGLLAESHWDAWQRRGAGIEPRYPPWLEDDAGALGRPMAQDHRRILATALGRLRGKIRYRPVVFELLPPTFTLLELQRVVESLAGLRLHKGNFRRLVEKGGLVEGTGHMAQTGGRPAERFRFRREVLRERRAPGVGLPGGRPLR
ncbi:MAG: hypothetical protein H6648_03840 [Caldilineae bacterium]|nr:hypothetical protein [Chloroflexota bacterium]MCB9176267.1 hypothetical protein [Caldilineae bacterium]